MSSQAMYTCSRAYDTIILNIYENINKPMLTNNDFRSRIKQQAIGCQLHIHINSLIINFVV